MDITPLIPARTHIIERYGNGRFTVSGEVHTGNIIVTPSMVTAWEISTVEALELESLAPLIAAKDGTEILLIGCGKRMALLPEALRQQLKQQGIAVDSMDTGAACRTYNVLLSEGRNVAAAVIAVE